jgi:hypothetical protein
MRVNLHSSLRLPRLRAVMMAASALAVSLVGSPASASTSHAGTQATAPSSPRVISPAFVNGRSYLWKNLNSGLCIAPSFYRGIGVRQELCDSDDDYGDRAFLFWNMQNVGGNNYRLVSDETKECLTVGGTSLNDGDPIQHSDCHDYSTQIFTAVPDPLGHPNSYQFKSLGTGKCVAIGGGRTDVGAWAIQWTCSSSPEFIWTSGR